MLYEFCLCGYIERRSGSKLIHDRVPIYSAASWASLTSLKVAFWIDPFRDVYEVSLEELGADKDMVDTASGVHTVHFLSTSYQLHWW